MAMNVGGLTKNLAFLSHSSFQMERLCGLRVRGLGKGLGVRLLGEEVALIGDQDLCVSLLVFLQR